MKPEELYEKIRELQTLKDSIEEDIKDYKNRLDSQLKPERAPEIKIVNIPNYIEDVKEYLGQRYPTYDLVEINDGEARIQEKESYVPKKIIFDNGGQFYRRVSAGKPTINLNLLEKNYPDHYESIIKMVPEIDEKKLNEKLENDPEFLGVVEEVLEMVRPSVALVATKPTEEE
jgi:hypothetical protein